MTGNLFPWFALRTKHQHERVVLSSLRGKGYEGYLPVYQSRRVRAGKPQSMELPLFPGYVFCRFDRNQRLPILTTPGVFSIVGVGSLPCEISQEEMDAVRRVADSGLQCQPHEPFMKVGQAIRITDGPLRDVRGILLAFRDTARVVVSISMLQRSIAVDVPPQWVVPSAADALCMAC